MAVVGVCSECGAPAMQVCSLCGRVLCPRHMARGANVCTRCAPRAGVVKMPGCFAPDPEEIPDEFEEE